MSKGKIKYVLELGGFRVGLDFEGSEQVVLRENLYRRIEEYWRDFLVEEKGREIDWWLKCEDSLVVWPKREGEYEWWLIAREEEKTWNLSLMPGLATFNTLLKRILVKLFLDDNGLVLHGSAVEHEGRVYVFVAPSGGGKSTTAKILEKCGWRHVADDLVFLRKVAGKWYIHGSLVIEKSYLPSKFVGRELEILVLNKGEKMSKREIGDGKLRLEKLLKQTVVGEGMSGEVFKRLVDLTGKIEVRRLVTSLTRLNELEELLLG